MPKNKIEDLRNLMMESIERLMDADDPMDAKTGIAISQLGNVVLNSAKIELQAVKMLGNTNTNFFDNKTEKPELKLIPAAARHELEMPDCKCGNEVLPADYEMSEKLNLGYPRCRECLDLLPERLKEAA